MCANTRLDFWCGISNTVVELVEDHFQTFCTIAIAPQSNVLNGVLGNLDPKRAFLKVNFFRLFGAQRSLRYIFFQFSACKNEVRILMCDFWFCCRTLLIFDARRAAWQCPLIFVFTLVNRFQTRKTFSTIAIAARSNVLNGALGNLDSKRAFLKAKFFQIAWSAKISTSNSFELSVCPNEVRILMHYFWCWCRTLLIIDTKAVSLTVSSNMGFNSGWRPFSNFLRTRYCTAKQCAQ